MTDRDHVGDAGSERQGASFADDLVLRDLISHADLREVERIQRDVWGLDDIEIVPSSQIRAALHAGGQAGGAFIGDALVGFSYGFLASPHGRLMEGPGLHSHMAAVRPEARGRGVGQALKWQQRDWCLKRDLAWITWTFDPLQARNANLNLRHLGAICVDYLVDFYGPMGGPLGGARSDRFLALWVLTAPSVVAIANGGAGGRPTPGAATVEPTATRGSAVWAVRPPIDGGGAEPVVELAGPGLMSVAEAGARVMVAAPPTDRDADPARARRWQDAFAQTIVPLFEAGYVAVDLLEGAYVLEPPGGGFKAKLDNL